MFACGPAARLEALHSVCYGGGIEIVRGGFGVILERNQFHSKSSGVL